MKDRLIPGACHNWLRREIASLWLDTFQDDPRYVDLIFDNYFDTALKEVHLDDDRLIASLLGIPYLFASADGHLLRGLYLCGLATRPQYRGRGIMSSLIEQINAQALSKGFDFTFLIPADSGLARYYAVRQYRGSFWRHILHIGHDSSQSDLQDGIGSATSQARSKCARERPGRCETGRCGMKVYPLYQSPVEIPALIDFLTGLHPEGPGFRMLHTRRDWTAVVEEACISGSHIAVCCDSGIHGVAFYELREDGIHVKSVETDNERSVGPLLEYLRNSYPVLDIHIVVPDGSESLIMAIHDLTSYTILNATSDTGSDATSDSAPNATLDRTKNHIFDVRPNITTNMTSGITSDITSDVDCEMTSYNTSDYTLELTQIAVPGTMVRLLRPLELFRSVSEELDNYQEMNDPRVAASILLRPLIHGGDQGGVCNFPALGLNGSLLLE